MSNGRGGTSVICEAQLSKLEREARFCAAKCGQKPNVKANIACRSRMPTAVFRLTARSDDRFGYVGAERM
ncbi:MAG: hypothetical protein LBK66_08375 [Spirochaetaceae bacterium]|nr:hypothetical protein [Spirochaetaceae bacterium]